MKLFVFGVVFAGIMGPIVVLGWAVLQ